MKIKVVLTRATVDLLWGLSKPDSKWVERELPLASEEELLRHPLFAQEERLHQRELI